MKNKILLFSSLFALTMAACSTNSNFPLGGKTFSFDSVTASSVDEGFYTTPDDFNGGDKDGYGNRLKEIMADPTKGSFIVEDTAVKNYTYNGASIEAYHAYYEAGDAIKNFRFAIAKGAEEGSYKLLAIDNNNPTNLVDYVASLGHSEGSFISTSGVTQTIVHDSTASFTSVNYNKDTKTLTMNISAVDTYEVNEETTIRKATFVVTWKA